MEIGKLLFATDMEKPDLKKLASLVALRKMGLEEIIFLTPGGKEEWEKGVAGYGLSAKSMAGEGKPLSRILEAAQQEGVCLIALSLKRTGQGVKPSIKNLLRSSHVPTIVLNRDSQSGSPETGLFHHVLYATDWSPLCDAILRYLLGFKGVIGMLEIVNVVNKKLSIRDMRNLKKKLVQTREIFLERGIDAEAHVYAGNPPDEIILASRDYGATSIVMGSSRRPPIRGLFSKSCSLQVAAESPIPVMLVNDSIFD